MSIKIIKRGDIFESKAQALVNPVNIVGTMGNGLAFAFKKKFPVNYNVYKSACHNSRMLMGEVLTCHDRAYSRGLATPVWIVNFPTKWHWKDPSQLIWIEQGLEALKEFILEKELKSVAIPALGCGQGQLEWLDVKDLIKKAMAPMKNLQVELYEPW